MGRGKKGPRGICGAFGDVFYAGELSTVTSSTCVRGGKFSGPQLVQSYGDVIWLPSRQETKTFQQKNTTIAGRSVTWSRGSDCDFPRKSRSGTEVPDVIGLRHRRKRTPQPAIIYFFFPLLFSSSLLYSVPPILISSLINFLSILCFSERIYKFLYPYSINYFFSLHWLVIFLLSFSDLCYS